MERVSRRIACPACLMELALGEVGGHVLSEHGGSGTWECGECGMATPDASLTAAHCLVFAHDVRRIRRNEHVFLSVLASVQHALAAQPQPRLQICYDVQKTHDSYDSKRQYQETTRDSDDFMEDVSVPMPAPRQYTPQPEPMNPYMSQSFEAATSPPEVYKPRIKRFRSLSRPNPAKQMSAQLPVEPEAVEDSGTRDQDSSEEEGRAVVEDWKDIPSQLECRCGRTMAGGRRAGNTILTHVMSRVHGHFTTGMYRCSVCGKTGNDRTNIQTHVKKSHASGSLEFTGDVGELRQEMEASFPDFAARFRVFVERALSGLLPILAPSVPQ